MRACSIPFQEFQRIRAAHVTLASTGCTQDFCQAGRLIHTDEPRIGENRSLLNIEVEAQSFLFELHREGFYQDEAGYQLRLKQALEEIKADALEDGVGGGMPDFLIGGKWSQTTEELEFGVRRAWRNSRKCIMRSHCEELKLWDLRHVASSKQMATDLIFGLEQAFNQGNIQPTVFVFPARTINGRGPMIMNNQILQFAGYELEDGSILGDPMSVELTRTIIDLGWEPPVQHERSRWDLLPLVTMAEGDKPFVAELPISLSQTVKIRHPQHRAQFEELDLRWVSFPALTRLGFDIGGVQYTAAPFIGWFMDAEIGVRDLADSFRYNVLPDVVKALGLTEGKFGDGIEDFQDLPEFEKLAMLSRAQTELNYAVHWSFLQAKISMTDSLTASMKWCNYDDDYRQRNGYRLPADPYWLAPPQGSIIPLWHRGGAPNYQPKPMISKHVYDPINVWARERGRWPDKPIEISYVKDRRPLRSPELQCLGPIGIPSYSCQEVTTELEYDLSRAPGSEQILVLHDEIPKSIAIYFSSAGMIAEKLALKLHKWMQKSILSAIDTSLESRVRPLNSLTSSSLNPNKVLLLIVSSTGQGDIPKNGELLVKMCNSMLSTLRTRPQTGFHFAVFGNGDSRYSSTFNGAAVKMNHLLQKVGGIPMAGGLFQGDVAVEPLPLRALKAWYTKVEPHIIVPPIQCFQRPSAVAFNKYEKSTAIQISVTSIKDAEQMSPVENTTLPAFDTFQSELLSTLNEGKITATTPQVHGQAERTRLMALNVAESTYEEMSCIQILPVNASPVVEMVLAALQVDSERQVAGIDGKDMSYYGFLKEFVDLEAPFSTLEWLSELDDAVRPEADQNALCRLSVREVLNLLPIHASLSLELANLNLRQKILLDMPLLRPRTYSIASSQQYSAQETETKIANQIEIMVKTIPSGRFSTTFIQNCSLPALVKYRVVESTCGPQIRQNHLAPIIVLATGAGFGPVRCLLQWRIALAREASKADRPLPSFNSAISLFLGFKACDLVLVEDVLEEAKALYLVDILEIVVSNPEKRRIHGFIKRYCEEVREKLLVKHGLLFVCSNRLAAEGARRVFGDVLGEHIGEKLGDRYVEEVF